jgi:hypothetical protein
MTTPIVATQVARAGEGLIDELLALTPSEAFDDDWPLAQLIFD